MVVIFFLRSFRKSEILKNAVSGRWCIDSRFILEYVSKILIAIKTMAITALVKDKMCCLQCKLFLYKAQFQSALRKV